jgi:hypothetical protein
MSDVSEKAYLIRLVKQRFGPMTRFLGPPYAGDIELDGLSGPLWLGEGPTWIWSASRKTADLGGLSDEQVARAASPDFLVRHLLVSCSELMVSLVRHLDLIEGTGGSSSALLRYYLENPSATVIDGIALTKILCDPTIQTIQ